MIVSRGEFLIISVTTSYIKGIKNRDTFTSRISPLFCWFQFEFTEKEIFSLSVLFSPPSYFRYEGCWKQEPSGLLCDLPQQLLIALQQPVFFSNGLFVSPSNDGVVSASEGDTGVGGSTWVALVTPSPLDIRCRHDEKRVSPGLKRKQLLCAAQHGAAACCLYTNRKGGYGYSLFF